MKERRNNVLCLGEFFPFLDEHVAAHFLGVAEINAAGGKFLVIFMALARNEDDVPQTGLLDSRGNGSGPVRDDGVSAFRHARRNLADDGEGFLASGIVGGDDAGV